MITLAEVERCIEAGGFVGAAQARASELLQAGEATLEQWLQAHGELPTVASREGFRVLALQHQGARQDPSFNACRETCRELVYHFNLVGQAESLESRTRALRMMQFVARHLFLFVSGKLVERGLGDFCCASRPLRQQDA